MTPSRFKKLAWSGGITFVAAILAFSAFYIVPEGHVAVVKFTGKADRLETPGFQTKIPFIEDVEIIEVRERKNVEELAGATANQLPVTATVSINWAVNAETAMDLFIRYGGLGQFEQRVLDPKIRSAAKAAISQFAADKLIRERQTVVAAIGKEILLAVEGLPVTITSPQLENVALPIKYLEAIEAKEQAREAAVREEHILAQQKLQAQQRVQTAEAERDALQALADGNAYKTLTEAKAEAEAIALINEQLSRSPAYVDLVRAKAWDGVMPRTMLGDGGSVLFSIGEKK